MSRAAFTVSNVRSAALRALNYSPHIERIRAASKLHSVPLSSLVEDFGPAYGTVFTRIDCAPEHGVELLSQTDMFAAEPRGRVIRRDSMARPERHDVKRLQVLIAGAGTLGENELYGRSILADSRLVGKCVGPDAMTVTFREPDASLSLFAYAFLASPTGVAAIRSTSYGTKILRFRGDLLGSLPIPQADDETVDRVASLIRICVKARETYARELQAARLIVEQLPEMRVAYEMCAERRARCVLWKGPLQTLSAWNHASAGEVPAYLRQRWSARISDVVERDGIFRGNRYTRVNCDSLHGVEMLSQRDVFLIRPVPRRIVKPKAPDCDLFVPTGHIVVAGAGTLSEGEIFGRPMYVSEIFSGKAYTELLLRISPTSGTAEELYAFLSTLVGLRLLRSTVYGSKLVYMRPEFVHNLPIPELTAKQRTSVRQHVIRAFQARDNSHHAEAEAIRIIEEEVLPAWLA